MPVQGVSWLYMDSSTAAAALLATHNVASGARRGTFGRRDLREGARGVELGMCRGEGFMGGGREGGREGGEEGKREGVRRERKRKRERGGR